MLIPAIHVRTAQCWLRSARPKLKVVKEWNRTVRLTGEHVPRQARQCGQSRCDASWIAADEQESALCWVWRVAERPLDGTEDRYNMS